MRMLFRPLQQVLISPLPPTWLAWVAGVIVATFFWGLYYYTYFGRKGRRDEGELGEKKEGDGDRGSVYVLSNPEYPGLVKVGMTTRDPETRANELSAHTGVPGPFQVEYALRVPNPKKVEADVHASLADHLASTNREFFEVSIEEARRTIEQVAEVGTGRMRRSRAMRAFGFGMCGIGLLAFLTTLAYLPELSSGVPPTLGSSDLPDLVGTWDFERSKEGPVVARVGKEVAVRLALGTIGCGIFLPLGCAVLWGWSLFRARPLYPLLKPTVAILCFALALSFSSGLAGLTYSGEAIGWSRQVPIQKGFVLWGGELGIALADQARTRLGEAGSLVPLGVLFTATGVLVLSWGREN